MVYSIPLTVRMAQLTLGRADSPALSRNPNVPRYRTKPFVLEANPSPESPSKAMVRFEKTGGSWTLGPPGKSGGWRGRGNVAPVAIIESRRGMIGQGLSRQHEAGRLSKENRGDCNGYAGAGWR